MSIFKRVKSLKSRSLTSETSEGSKETSQESKKESKQPLDRNYISSLGRFLKEFDTKPEASSESRRAEEAEYAKIFYLRDNVDPGDARVQIWEQPVGDVNEQ